MQQYDTFDKLYVVDKDTGRRTFLSDIQVEQFDTFRQTERQLGARAGAAKLHRRAKELRDASPAALKVKMYNALRDLDQRLQTPSGQRVLVGESPYFGGSLIKTRAAMVMAVQVQLQQRWSQLRGTSDLMPLADVVDVLQLMGFNATMQTVQDVLDRWPEHTRSDGLVNYRQFLKWTDLESCFVKNDDPNAESAAEAAALAVLAKEQALLDAADAAADAKQLQQQNGGGGGDGEDDEFDDGFADDALQEAMHEDDPAADREQELRDDLAEANGRLKSGELSPEEAAYWRSRAEDIQAELAALTGNWDNNDVRRGTFVVAPWRGVAWRGAA